MKFCNYATPGLLALAVLLGGCREKPVQKPEKTEPAEKADYGTADGKEIAIFTLRNPNGLVAKVTEFGATLVSVQVPDKDGKVSEITHGYDKLAGWVADTNYFGATVGRYGNRIAGGKFSLDGEDYSLALNNEPAGIPCSLHGGVEGFNKKIWEGKTVEKDKARGVEFSYTSEDGEEGYPGELEVTVTWWLTDDNELVFEAEARTDKATPVNIVNHTYWNLSDDPASSIEDHELQIFADAYLPTNAGLIPTGEIAPVAGTPMDFTRPTVIGKRINDDFEALKLGGGYDHAWVLRQSKGEENGVRLVARLRDPESGRVMEVHSNQPALQFYSGNFLDGTAIGRDGVAYPKRSALALEAEAFPDAPNQPDFPDAILRPGETYKHKLVYKFYAK